jgi:hypothetical protein
LSPKKELQLQIEIADAATCDACENKTVNEVLLLERSLSSHDAVIGMGHVGIGRRLSFRHEVQSMSTPQEWSGSDEIQKRRYTHINLSCAI